MELLYSLAETVVQHLWAVSYQVSILIVVIWLIDRLSFRASSMFRYWLWMIVVIRLCTPGNLSLPSGTENYLGRYIGNVTPDVGKYIPFRNLYNDFNPHIIRNIPAVKISQYNVIDKSAKNKKPLTATGLIGIIWFCATGAIALLLVFRIFQVRRLLKGGILVARPDINSLVKIHAEKYGIRRSISVYSMDTDVLDIPAVVCIRNPRIILPAAIVNNWQTEEIEPVILHELAHIRRYDLMVNMLQMIVQIVYFFHPFVWYANSRIRRIREEVCDDIAVKCLSKGRSRYTLSILRIMEETFHKKSLGFVGIGFSERKSSIGERIRRIMSKTYRNSTKMTVFSVIVLVVIGFLGMLLACEHTSVTEEPTDTGVNVVQKTTTRIDVPAEYVIGSSPLNRKTLEKLGGIDESNTPDFDIIVATAWAQEITPSSEFIRAVQNVADAVMKYSIIDVTYNDKLYLDSPVLFNTAVIFISSDKPFTLTEAEQANLNKYINDGGFVVVNNSNSEEAFSSTEESLRNILNSVSNSDFNGSIAPVTNDHPLFHTFFDFMDSPPSGKTWTSREENYIEGLWQGDKLSGLYWDNDYTQKWNEASPAQLKFGLNMVIYGFLRDGGILQKAL